MDVKAYINKDRLAQLIYFENEFNEININYIKKHNLIESKNLEKLIKKFINGENVNFQNCFDLNTLPITSFQRKVYIETLKIPKGKTRTYKEIGNSINSQAYQAIGGALSKNPLPFIIPCHRVIGSNNQLTGYRGGLKLKKQLLLNEGIKFRNDKII